MPEPSPLEHALFVYGTLRCSAGHPMHRVLSRYAHLIGPGAFCGILYDLGAYPGAVPSPNPEDLILGEVYALDAPCRVFPALDAYEGPGYTREKRPVILTSDDRIQAWIYLYTGPTAHLHRILSGDFLSP